MFLLWFLSVPFLLFSISSQQRELALLQQQKLISFWLWMFSEDRVRIEMVKNIFLVCSFYLYFCLRSGLSHLHGSMKCFLLSCALSHLCCFYFKWTFCSFRTEFLYASMCCLHFQLWSYFTNINLQYWKHYLFVLISHSHLSVIIILFRKRKREILEIDREGRILAPLEWSLNKRPEKRLRS